MYGVKFAYVSVDIFFACCVFDGVCELFVECVCYMFVCGGCFVAEGDSVVVSLGRFYFLAHAWFSTVCACFVCDPIFCLDVPCCCRVNLVFVFSVVNIRRWSEISVCFVCQVVLL